MAFTGGAPRPTSITAQKPSTRPGSGASPLGFSGPVRPNFGPGVGAPGPQGFSGPVRPNFGPGVGLPAPAAAPAPAPAAPAAPAASPQSSSSSASPLDSTYYGNLAANQFKVGNAINNLQRTAGEDNTALQSALDQLAYQQPRDQLKVEENANRTGGLYSSAEAQNEGNLVHAYATRQNAAVTGNAQKIAAIQSQISALQGGVPIFEGQQYDDAVARAIKAAASNPATGQDSGSTGTSPPTAPNGQPIDYTALGRLIAAQQHPTTAAPKFTTIHPGTAPTIGGVKPPRVPVVPKIKAPKGIRTGFTGGPVFA